MVDVVDATLANREVFMRWHANDAKVSSSQYRKANGIPSSFDSDIDSP